MKLTILFEADVDLRRLERQARSSGDIGDLVQYYLGLLRVGEVSVNDLKLAAILGSPTAGKELPGERAARLALGSLGEPQIVGSSWDLYKRFGVSKEQKLEFLNNAVELEFKPSGEWEWNSLDNRERLRRRGINPDMFGEMSDISLWRVHQILMDSTDTQEFRDLKRKIFLPAVLQ